MRVDCAQDMEDKLVLSVAAAHDMVAVNQDTRTTHAVIWPGDVAAQCGWHFQYRSKSVRASIVQERDLFSCANCYDLRVPFLKVVKCEPAASSVQLV